MPVQTILNPAGQPDYAVLAWPEYLQLLADAGIDAKPSASFTLLNEDGFTIRMPHGGPGRTLDVRELVEVWLRRGTVDVAFEVFTDTLAVNARKQALTDFKRETINTLDPIVRRCFLPVGSPYRDTMQVTVRFVDALVETGVFSRVMSNEPGFYRPVQALKIDEVKAQAFLEKFGMPERRIDRQLFILA